MSRAGGGSAPVSRGVAFTGRGGRGGQGGVPRARPAGAPQALRGGGPPLQGAAGGAHPRHRGVRAEGRGGGRSAGPEGAGRARRPLRPLQWLPEVARAVSQRHWQCGAGCMCLLGRARAVLGPAPAPRARGAGRRLQRHSASAVAQCLSRSSDGALASRARERRWLRGRRPPRGHCHGTLGGPSSSRWRALPRGPVHTCSASSKPRPA
mmetsp:Transcript_10359/g.28131  ORF Transcript_10359/g.28131 Transcript_10359/m.28131 type:complete len:208 (-) Transcript_10359:25-648(-)